MTMKPPPPMPQENGSTTPSTPAAAIAASTALPPERRTSIAALVASGSTVAADPPLPIAVGVLGGSGTWARAGNAATSAMRTARTARPAMRDMRRLLPRLAPRLPQASGNQSGRAEAHVEVVVVVDQRRDDAARPVQAEARADEDPGRRPADEAVHELLGEPAVDLGGAEGGALEAVATGVVDVDVEAGLVRRVAEPAVARAEEAAVRAREVADEHAGDVGMGRAVLAQHDLHALDDLGPPPAPPFAVRRSLEHRVPGHEVGGLGGEGHAAEQPALGGGRRGQREEQRSQRDREDYLPCHAGDRFSAKARTPS